MKYEDVRVNFDHDSLNVLDAVGVKEPEIANAISMDANHPDCMKMRFMGAILNSDVNLVMSIWAASLVGPDIKLTGTMSKNLEIVLSTLDEEALKTLDNKINMFNGDVYSEDTATVIEEALKEIIPELVEERKAEEPDDKCCEEDDRNV